MTTQSEHSRDAGVTFESTESHAKTRGSARQDDEVVSKQSEHSRDAGVTFETTETHAKTRGSARRDDEVVSKPMEHGRDAGVIFGNTESRRPAAAPAPGEKTAVPSQSEHGRDAGVIFGDTVSRQAGAPAPRKVEVIERERSRDAGITFGKTEADRQSKAPAAREEEGGIWTMAESMFGLGRAAAKFSFDQIRSGFCMMTDPGKGLRRVQHSIDNVSRAMNEPVEDASAHPES